METVEQMFIGYLDILDPPATNPAEALMKRFNLSETYAQIILSKRQ